MTDFYRKSYKFTAGFFRRFYRISIIGAEETVEAALRIIEGKVSSQKS
ncbi:MAG: hypothetical protein MJ070_10210 [Lachnospiraceae bacterium]|nr:hypothetical protein [Lachnospiraceae bacterium]